MNPPADGLFLPGAPTRKPAGNGGGFPTKRGTGDVLGPTLVSVSLLGCRFLWPHRLAPSTAPRAREAPAVPGLAGALLLLGRTPRVKRSALRYNGCLYRTVKEAFGVHKFATSG
jgi:hypothetical protein